MLNLLDFAKGLERKRKIEEKINMDCHFMFYGNCFVCSLWEKGREA